MSLNKLSRMVNAKNAMSFDWGKILFEYMATRTSKESAQKLRKNGVIADVLSDGCISREEVISSKYLKLSEHDWYTIGDEIIGLGSRCVEKADFIKAMRIFCEQAAACFKDFSKCRTSKDRYEPTSD